MTTIGIDPSINSTGVCVDKNGKHIYYIIPSHMTKKMTSFSETNKDIIYLPYEKLDTKNLSYADKEYAKTQNICKICSHIDSILKKYKPDLVIMEGVSYGSTGSAALVDLSGLQFSIRMTILNRKCNFKIISPMGLKKFAVANGSANKDIIIDAWLRLEPKMSKIQEIKIDDLADAYFLSQCTNQL